jgi:hypothetical protein
MKHAVITIAGPNFTDVEEVELLAFPAEGDPIQTKYGICIVTGVEVENGGHDGRIDCRLP